MKRILITVFLLSGVIISINAQASIYNYGENMNSLKRLAPHLLKSEFPENSDFSHGSFYAPPHSLPSKQRNDKKYALKGISFHRLDNGMLDGTYEYFYDIDGDPTRTVFLGCAEYVVDSGVSIYYKNSMSWDYYGYMKNFAGEYEYSYKWETIYASPEENGSDSTYVENYTYNWNKERNRWDNYYKDHIDHFSSNYSSRYAIKIYASSDGTDWIINSTYREPYHIEYNQQGLIEKYYVVQHNPPYNDDSLLFEYKYKEDGSFYEYTISYRENGAWILDVKTSEIEWKEYYGFTWVAYIDSYPRPEISPFSPNRNKIASYREFHMKNGEWELARAVEIDWDIDGTRSYKYASYYVQNGIATENPIIVNTYLFNEQGDFIRYTNSAFSLPNENEEAQERKGTTYFWDLTYEEDYGLSGSRSYAINYGDDGTGVPDTSFHGGYLITEFGPLQVDAVTEPELIDSFVLSIFPNPAKGSVSIIATDIMDQIELFDLSGQMLQAAMPKATKTELQLDNLSPGVYLLKVRLKNGGAKTEKLIIQ